MFEQDYAPENQEVVEPEEVEEVEAEYTEEEYAQEVEASKGKSIAALVFGILSIVANLPAFPLPFAWVIALASTIISKVLLKSLPESGLQKGAKITSTIGMIMTIVWGALTALLVVLYLIYIILVAVLGIGLAFSLPFLQ